jgi:hypothetical protein
MRDYRPTYKQDAPPLWIMAAGIVAAAAVIYLWLVVVLSL